MSKYTMELRYLQAGFYAAMQDYPIFEESYREKLNTKIYNACKFREIGYETPELFLDRLRQWMDLHMPEYNWLYNSLNLELTPLQRTKLIEIYDSNGMTTDKRLLESIETIKGKDVKDEERNAVTIDRNKKVDEDNTSVEYNGWDTTNTKNYNHGDVTDNQWETLHSEVEVDDTQTGDSTDDTDSFHSDFPQANLTDKEDSNYYTYGDKSHTHSRSTDTDNGTTTTDSTTHTNNKQTTNMYDDTDQTMHSSNKTTNSGTVTTHDDTDTHESETDKSTLKSKQDKKASDTEDKTGTKHEQYVKERTGQENLSDYDLIEQYRKAYINIDNRIIRAIKKELFMNVW